MCMCWWRSIRTILWVKMIEMWYILHKRKQRYFNMRCQLYFVFRKCCLKFICGNIVSFGIHFCWKKSHESLSRSITLWEKIFLKRITEKHKQVNVLPFFVHWLFHKLNFLTTNPINSYDIYYERNNIYAIL